MKLRNKKTGEIDDFIFEVIDDRIDLYRRVGSSDTKNIWQYNSLAKLNEEWNDYKPKEPLIKVEKVRKAVRAWAEVNNYEKCIVRVYDYDRAGTCIPKGVTSFVSCEAKLGITFFGINLDIKKETPYTIAELCGEEE